MSINSFGPAEPGEFDFTPLFEDTFLSLLPSTILLLVLPSRIISLHGKTRKVSGSSLHSSKLLFLVVYACMNTVLLVLRIVNPTLRTKATLAAASITVVDSLGLCVLSHTEHIHSVRPSAIINVYLLLTLPFDLVRSRTLWIDGATRAVAAIFTSSIAVKIIVLVAEAMEKRSILLDRYRNSSPEVTSGIYSRSFFWWLNSLMTTGFRRVINNEDLYPIDPEMTSAVLQEHAQKTWEASDKTKSRALFWSTLKASRKSLAYVILPRICLIGFRYAQPFLLSRTVDFASSSDERDLTGWGLTAAFGLVLLGQAVANGSYYHMTYRFVVSVRGSLVSMIYTKTVDLSITALSESAPITLMASDTEAICQAFTMLHEFWAVPIELGIALWLLERQLGYAFFAPGAIAFIATAGILMMAKYIGNAQKIWIEGIQTRVGVTAAALGAMKGVKMLGFTKSISGIVQALRVTELMLSSKFRRLLCGRVFLANSINTLAPLVTFVVFVIIAKYSGTQLDASSAFTALSLISLLKGPMNTLISAIPMLNAAMACFDRIQQFLSCDARRDHRLSLNDIITSNDLPRASGIALKALSPPISRAGSIMISQNSSFGWNSDQTPAVTNVSFTLKRHQYCFIIGPVGSGKSTLLKGLLGETPSSQGFVYSSSSSTAYVDQSPWIQNGTIQANILGISSFEEPWYSQVVRSCALEFDISNLPKGHATPVGSAGISLSGGQKQRLALARAVYSRKQLLILDDVFSGLDAETEEQIFDRLFADGGLFRAMGTTVILVTHAVHRLPYSDQIIGLDALGKVCEQGTFDKLKASGGYVETLSAKLRRNDKSEKSAKVEPIENALFVAETKELDVEVEELNRQTGDFAVYRYYFASIGWRLTAPFAMGVILYGVSERLTQFLVTYWTDAVALHGNSVNVFYLALYTMLAFLSTVGLVGGAWQMLIFMVPKSAEVLHERLLNTVMSAPLSFFTSTDIGTTTNRFSQDMTVIDGELPYSLVDLVLTIVSTIMSAILMCLSAGYFAATMPPVILCIWVLQNYYLKISRQLRLLDLEAKSPLFSHFIESLQGLVTIRAFGLTGDFEKKNLILLDMSQKPYYLLFCIQRWLALILDLLVAVLAVILMVLIVKLRATISGSFVGLALLNVMSFNESLATIIKEWTSLETSFGAISRLMKFSVKTTSENLTGETQLVPESWPTSGSIIFKNVSASYTADSDLVVRNLDLEIRAGEKIGICGRSGSGKSSLISSLFRMLELREGTIIVDGIDIASVPRQIVRERLNAIPQEPIFIQGSIRLNSDPCSLHSDSDIIAAIRKVHLWELVSARGGLGTALDAEFFSVGQRQLFCLARAILRKSKVVVLDEVTSSVDAKSDELMQKVIREEFHDFTVIVVAHRLDTILDFDRIALLSGGELKELDTPGKLLAGPSLFRELYYS